MSTLKNKIDFAVIVTVDHANPNGDPLNGNRPRTTYSGNGEISEIVFRIWGRKYLYSLMTGVMMDTIL